MDDISGDNPDGDLKSPIGIPAEGGPVMDVHSASISQKSTPSESDTKKRCVLVTGGSGYLASWTIVDLLRRGYDVRTTVRSLSREPQVRSMISRAAPTDGRLSFVE